MRPSLHNSDRGLRGQDVSVNWLDRAVVSGLALLLVVTPLALGSVRRRAFVAMECAIFLLAFAAAIKWAREKGAGGQPAARHEARRLCWPMLAMVVLMLVQLTPMPPAMLRLLSPTAYRVYRVAFPGWPDKRASDLTNPTRAVFASPGNQSRPEDNYRPQPLGAAAGGSRGSHPADAIVAARWQTLSLAPSVTGAALLEMLALGAVFFIVLLYPFGNGGREAERRFQRIMLYMIVATAALIALLALVQRAWWNGKILWWYVPRDWPGPLRIDRPRASGPFVNPDHLADYLSLILPLTVGGALFSFSIIPRARRANVQLLFAAAAAVELAASALSLSRSGAVAIAAGIILMLVAGFTYARDRAPRSLQGFGRVWPLALAIFALIVLAVVYLVGGPARTQLGQRVAQTGRDSIAVRLTTWRETLPMIRDFPLVGVGLGAWPEMFPHYHAPPASQYYFFRAAEDDYLQFAAEAGISGLAILLVFSVLVIEVSARRARQIASRRWPLFGGLAAGVGAGLLAEVAGFALHIPAIALMFTVIVAFALRVVLYDPPINDLPLAASRLRSSRKGVGVALAAGIIALLLLPAALRQDGRAYPYAIGQPRNLSEAAVALLAHPAMASTHLALARMLPATCGRSRRSQLQAALWLDPNDSLARDLYARELLLAGDKADALRQITISIYRTPILALHYYLLPSAIPWLLPDEQQAVARGFARAIDRGFRHAAVQLASLEVDLGRYRDAAIAYRAGARTDHGSDKVGLLVDAGNNYARAGDYASALGVLGRTSELAPNDPRPYVALMEDVYGPQQLLGQAGAVVETGIARGADPYSLEMALAEAAEHSGSHLLAEAALVRALHYAPSFKATLWLGRVYLEEHKTERAVATLQQAAAINPNSAEAYIWFGRAAEADYDYSQAALAYARAVKLAPGDRDARAEYLNFRQRTAGDTSSAPAQSADR